MKKIRISIVLLAGWIMLLLCGAAAETQTIPSIRDTVDSAVKPFSFRNGVLWGMDSAQVQSTESIQMDERSSGEWSVMVSSEPVEVSRFTADLIYMFRDNALQMIGWLRPGAAIKRFGQILVLHVAHLVFSVIIRLTNMEFNVKRLTNENCARKVRAEYSDGRPAIWRQNHATRQKHGARRMASFIMIAAYSRVTMEKVISFFTAVGIASLVGNGFFRGLPGFRRSLFNMHREYTQAAALVNVA